MRKKSADHRASLRTVLALACLWGGATAHAADLAYKQRYLGMLVEHVPRTLKNYDAATGRFGGPPWICTDQNVMLPLAVAYSTKSDRNPYYKDAGLLEVIMKSGDALIDDQDANGQWEFRKKDGSTWGKISMPWTYSRWVRTYSVIKNDMPADRRERWAKALTLGYSFIEKTQFGHVHNIPTHQAMGLYVAGKALNRPEWCTRADKFIHTVIKKQCEGGYWEEGEGPVVNYNFVYVDAIGTYYVLSGDGTVLPAIEKAIAFHTHFTYPSGQEVETIDQRNPYSVAMTPGNPTFTLTPEGRAWLQRQWRLNDDGPLSDDAMALFVLHGLEGPVADLTTRQARDLFIMPEDGVDRAATLRKGPWFIVLSAYTTPVANNRWHQDRQNLVSIWHEKTGLIVGGGNTKLQPRWSNFTVGDMSLLQHRAGDENPDFRPKGELYHVPKAAVLVREPLMGLDLAYGPETCRIRVEVKDDRTLEYTLEATTVSGKRVLGHMTLLPHLKSTFSSGGGRKGTLGSEPIELSPAQLGGELTYHGCRLTLPTTASLHWPVLPHNPYRKDGHAGPAEGRLEIRIPFDETHPRHTITLTVQDAGQ